MKDYYKLDDKFILNYKVRKNNIIIRFTNGEKIVATKDNTSLVNLIMKKQVKEFDKDSLIKDENKLVKKTLLITSFILFGILLALVFSFINTLISCMIGFVSIASGIFVCDNISKLSEINDSLKNIEFIENEELINGELKKENVLINSPRKVKKIVKKRKEKPVFDINNIEKMSYNELKQMLNLIEKIKLLTSNEEIIEEELGKRKELTMKKPN